MNKYPFIALTGIIAFTLAATSAALAAKTKTETQSLDVGTYQVSVSLNRKWSTEIDRDKGYVLFHYSDSSVRENAMATALIGLFRSIIPVEARQAGMQELANAYAINDASGAQQALLKTKPALALASRKAETINSGSAFHYVETADSAHRRTSSTKFVRVSVFFPKAFPETGVIFLVVGREEFGRLELRPDELEKMSELIAGIGAP